MQISISTLRVRILMRIGNIPRFTRPASKDKAKIKPYQFSILPYTQVFLYFIFVPYMVLTQPSEKKVHFLPKQIMKY